MALFTINYGSDVINKYMGINVILPDEGGIKDKDDKFAVIYLLHGYTDDYSKWLRMTNVERYAMESGYAIVMPDAGKSFYTDMVHGDPYFTYITEEIPKKIGEWFPITSDPDLTFIAGISMGGYGAMKIALTYPERFKAAGSFSGALVMAQIMAMKLDESVAPWMKRLEIDLPLVYGENADINGTKHDLFALITKNKAAKLQIPKLYASCGIEDFLVEGTRAFKQALDAYEIPCKYSERPGAHGWEFWEEDIQLFMAWIATLD